MSTFYSADEINGAEQTKAFFVAKLREFHEDALADMFETLTITVVRHHEAACRHTDRRHHAGGTKGQAMSETTKDRIALFGVVFGVFLMGFAVRGLLS